MEQMGDEADNPNNTPEMHFKHEQRGPASLHETRYLWERCAPLQLMFSQSTTRAMVACSAQTEAVIQGVSLNLARLFGQLLARAMASPIDNRPSKGLGPL
jgi:hypothetical protein